ncbi:MAG: translocation/assembly module TamB domain-containing protein [Bacillota bacterium]|nr:translocation/assembly module TamB domain-containing protein [Bacillota bacterium]
MRYKHLFLIVLLMFVILASIFIYNIRGLFYNLEEEIFAYLEKNYQIELEVGSFIFWPVNQITLKDVQINSLEQNFSISTPELNIYYNLFSFISDGNFAIALNYINLESPLIEIANNKDLGEGDFDIFAFIDRLPLLPACQFRVNDGQLTFIDWQNQFTLEDIDLLVKSSGPEDCQIKLAANLLLDRLVWQQFQLEDLELDNLDLTFSLASGQWQAVLESDYLALTDLAPYPGGLDFALLPLAIDKLEGDVKPLLFVSGNKDLVESYNSSFVFKDTRGEFSFWQEGREERLNLENLSGTLSFDSTGGVLYTEGIEFFLNGNPLKLSGRVDDLFGEEMEVFANLKSNQFQLKEIDFWPEYLSLDGMVALDISLAGFPANMAINLDLSMAEGSINNIKLENLVGKARYNQGNLYLDKLNFILGDTGQLSINGIYNRNDNYSFNLEGHYLDLALLQDLGASGSTPLLPIPGLAIGGKLNIMVNFLGHGLAFENLLASGKLELVEPGLSLSFADYNFNHINSNFYLTGQRLLLQEGELLGQWGKLAFSGELGLLRDGDLNLNFAGDSLNLAGLMNESGLKIEPDPDLKGKLRLNGSVKGTILSPIVALSLYSEEGLIYGIHYDNLAASLNYSQGEICLEEIALNYSDNLIQGMARIDLLSGKPLIDASISSIGLDLKTILNLAGGELGRLPLNGSLETVLTIKGPLEQAEIMIQGKSRNTSLYISNQELFIDQLAFKLKKERDKFLLEEFLLKQAEANMWAGGIISGDRFALDYKLEDLSLTDLFGKPLKENLEGKINIEGRLSGSFLEPALSGSLDIHSLSYQREALGLVQGSFYYYAGDLALENIVWQNGDQEYRLRGKIKDFLLEPYLELSANTDHGRISDLFFLELPPALEEAFLADYYISGDGYLRGNLEDLTAWLDFQLINLEKEDSRIFFRGNLFPDLDIHVLGEEIVIDKFLEKYIDASIRGQLALEGDLKGDLNNIQAFLNTCLENILIEGMEIEGIEGSLEVKEGGLLSIQQLLNISRGQTLQLAGIIDLREGGRARANMELQSFPLELLSVLDSSFPYMAGLLTGDLELDLALTGSDLEIKGLLYLEEGELDLRLPENFRHLNGFVHFQGEDISLKKIKGNYGNGQVEIEGIINPFARDNNLDLILKGQNLPFAHGSVEGYFDLTGLLRGPFREPMIEAELLTHNLNVGLPFEWPVMGGIGNWKYDLVLYPGEDVYLLNNNINVLIQEGQLKVQNTSGQLALLGELYSSQGTFDFYNNKFFLQNGRAKFEQSFVEKDRYIPQVNINAWTNVGGARINVQLNGKANNMIATFTSAPPLSEEEILTILTSKGGLGEFVSGNLGDVVYREFFRWLHNQIQLDFITDVQESLRKVFELDRFELDTYNWLWANQLSLYLGKRLNDRLYLEYVNIIGNEERLPYGDYGKELKLQYFLDENMILEGSWQGEGEYSFSLETKYEF